MVSYMPKHERTKQAIVKILKKQGPLSMKGITSALVDRKWYNIPSPSQLGNLLRDVRFKVVGHTRTSFAESGKVGDSQVYDVPKSTD